MPLSARASSLGTDCRGERLGPSHKGLPVLTVQRKGNSNQMLQQTAHAKEGSSCSSVFSRVRRLLSLLFGQVGGVMDDAVFRQALRSFLGPERYQKFVKHLSYGQRMRYWQEKAWGQFLCARPESAISVEELRRVLRICWVHEVELVAEALTVVSGLRDLTGYYLRTYSDVCPCAQSTALLWGEGCPLPPCSVVTSYCPECRQVYEAAHPGTRRLIDWRSLADPAKETS
jgi:hypothetical protein